MEQEVLLSYNTLRLLCASGDGDAALLYLWQQAADSSIPCPLPPQRREAARQTLCRLGLEQRESKPLQRNEPPAYSEGSVQENLQRSDFQGLVGEVQRRLGRILSTEELKSLLSIHDYLRLPVEVVSILVSYCIQRSRERGGRLPGMRTMEKEAYHWVDLGIDNVEAAVQYMQAMLLKQSRRGGISRILQITDRRLTSAEEQYTDQWIDWGFPDEVIRLAYEKTCLNTGGLKWAYMNSILRSWQKKGLLTVKQIREGDGKNKTGEKKNAIGDLEREALRKLMEKKEG